MQDLPFDDNRRSSAYSLGGDIDQSPRSTFKISDSLEVEASKGIPLSIRFNHSPDGGMLLLPIEPVERTVTTTSDGTVTIQSTSHHRLDAAVRWADARELEGQQGRQHSTCITVKSKSGYRGYIIPEDLTDGATLVTVTWEHDSQSPQFDFYEFRNGHFNSMPAITPGERAGIMHATQNLSHINEGLKFLKSASGTGRADISLVLPSVARSEILSKALSPSMAEKVSGWTYVEDGNRQFTTDFSCPSSMETIVGFIGCNLDLARRVRAGEFKVLSSDFRAEPQLLALLNPNVVLAGYNYTFLSGRPETYAARLHPHPLSALLLDTAESLNSFGMKLTSEGESATSCDWWNLTSAKLGATHRRLDALVYRTLRFDRELPTSVEGIPVIQVPHPVAPLTISREEARKTLAAELGFDPKTAIVVVIPGLSDDGQFEQRLQMLARIAARDDRIVMISPLSSEKLAQICGVASDTPRVHGIGFREKWGEVLVACDAAIIRGSWGEILDCIRAGVVPIFSSPGIIEPGNLRSRDLFLQEVLGERAMNLALLFDALEKEGIPRDILSDLIVGAKAEDSTLENAIKRGTEPRMTLAVQSTFKRIRRDGVEQLVDTYAGLKELGRKPEQHEVDSFHRRIWGDICVEKGQ